LKYIPSGVVTGAFYLLFFYLGFATFFHYISMAQSHTNECIKCVYNL
jgi:hypothetical protein